MSPPSAEDGERLRGASAIAREAGAIIMGFDPRRVVVRRKGDRTPVTDADEAANALIAARLKELDPDIPLIAEESVAAGEVPPTSGPRFWLVDPLDGTKEFIAGRDEFTVNIALIERRRPALGVIYLPALDRLYYGIARAGAFRRNGTAAAQPIHVRKLPAEGATVVASRSHFTAETERWLSSVAVAATRFVGSSLKFCLLAEGRADLYPRLGRTMEWDIAAGHALLAAAGGHLATLDGGELTYGKSGFENPHFIARGGA